MPEAYKTNPAVFPPAEVLAKCEYARYGGTEVAKLLDEALTRLRAS